MPTENNAQYTVAQRLIRLGGLLRVLMEKDTVSTFLLCSTFSTTARTIQRDLKALRKAGFPIHEEKRGVHRLDKSLIRNMDVYDEAELALIVAVKDLVTHLGRPFETAADHVFNRLQDYADTRPVFVRIDEPALLSKNLTGRIVKAINSNKKIVFYYKKYGFYEVVADPYRIAYYDGIWYLIARDKKDSKIKKYALDKISDCRLLRTPSSGIPSNLDDLLDNSVNIWFTPERNIDVKIEVDTEWAGYFERRNILPLQEIIEKRHDGSLLLKFKACNPEEIAVCIKPWLPHVIIIEPKDIRDSILADFKEWIKKSG